MEYFRGIDMVVCNYRTAQDLLGFLRSYIDSDITVPNTLTVVNVCPGSDDVGVVHQMAAEMSMLYMEHDENVGYARACNRASYPADREVIAFFNADTELRPGVVESCYDLLMHDPQVAVVGPRQVNERGQITHGGIFGTMEKPDFAGRWLAKDDVAFHGIQDCVTVAGSAYFVRRRAWDELATCRAFTECPDVWEREPEGAFLPTQHYYEETYLSYHAQIHGYKVVYNGEVSMVHKWHRASPVGSVEGGVLEESRRLFRSACDFHGIPHD